MGAALLQKLLIVSLGMLLAPRVINKLGVDGVAVVGLVDVCSLLVEILKFLFDRC